MNILLTGACGYIGSHVADLLSSIKECKLFVIDDLSTGFADALDDSVYLAKFDLADGIRVAEFIKEKNIEAIFHFAGKISVPESVENPLYYYANNTVNTLNLLSAAKKGAVKYFVFSSTAAVYAEPSNGEKITENFPVSPKSPYGASKLMSERMIGDASSVSGMKFAILRYFNVSGANPEMRLGQRNKGAKHLIKMCCKVLTGETDSLSVFGNDYPTPDGTGIRDYIHVSDLAQAHVDVLDYLRSGGTSEIFNVGYGRGFSVLEVVRAIEEVSGRKIPLKFEARRAGDCARIVSSNDKILAMTKWRPKYDDIKQIVSDSLKWEEKMKSTK